MKKILILKSSAPGARQEFFDDIVTEIKKRGTYDIDVADNVNELAARLEINPRICAVLYDWDSHSLKIAYKAASINEKLPIFAFSYSRTGQELNLEDLELNLSFLDYHGYSAVDYVNRIEKAIKEYYEAITPPFTKTLFKYVEENKYPFCTPGHLGGSAYLKSPVGSVFYDFYGANSFKADISISMEELGSLLDHSGPHKEAEEYIAHTFGADRSFMVTNGTSTANKIVGMSVAHQDATILVDRNCHKSLTHLLMMVDVKPIFLQPTRNRYGIIGGIPKAEFSKKSIQNKIDSANQTAKKHKNKYKYEWPIYAVITNSTYDGLFYDCTYIKKTLDVKHIHFDSAWVPYTNFSPIYKGLYGLYGATPKGKAVYETQSTHKLLAAYSQASMIHIKGEFDEDLFNEAYMMHTSTSPQYSIVASCEMAAAMMQGNTGKRLIENSQKNALIFRQEIQKLEKQNKDGWFFSCWQPSNIGKKAECWPLKTKDKWHEFKAVDDKFMHLDPIKITLLMPGMKNGKLTDFGIPADIVARFLDYHDIIVEKTGPYSILFLFSIGVDKARSLKLLTTLLEFKRMFDANLTVRKVLPDLYAIDPVFYKNMKIQDLAARLHAVYKKHDLPEVMFKAFDILPEQSMTPYKAYQKMLKGETKKCNIKDILNKICAEMILPYPPGIPVVLPGEMVTKDSKTILDFLLTLCDIGEHFPGLETDIHGAWKEDDNEYYTTVID